MFFNLKYLNGLEQSSLEKIHQPMLLFTVIYPEWQVEKSFLILYQKYEENIWIPCGNIMLELDYALIAIGI